MVLRITRLKTPLFRNIFIPWFIHHFNVDMSSAQNHDWRSYSNFNCFFTRALKPDARLIVAGDHNIASPVDGYVSQVGRIDHHRLYQAKGHSYSLQALLGGSSEHAAHFNNGHFIMLYLSPKDYHRIHMPLTGQLQEMIYVPGRLFSVNPATTRTIPGLFARNERVICLFKTQIGTMALIMVGAMCVACMEVAGQGVITPRRGNKVHHWKHIDAVTLKRGQEMGRFNMGSTVILLFESNRITWDSHLTPEMSLKMGQGLGTIVQKPT